MLCRPFRLSASVPAINPARGGVSDNLYQLLQHANQLASTGSATVFGVEPAIVTNFKDPEKLGRVKVCFPRLPGKPESDWARVVQPAAGAGRGFYWIPQVNDEVLVSFERGHPGRPFVLGSLWNGKDKPMEKGYSDLNSTIAIQTRSGHQIVLDDKEGEESITIGDKSGKRTITFDAKNKKLLIQAGEGDVILKAEKKLVFGCEDLEIKTSKTGKLEIGSSFDLNVAGKCSIKAGPQLELKASRIEINPPSLSAAALVARALARAAAAAAAALSGDPEHGKAVQPGAATASAGGRAGSAGGRSPRHGPGGRDLSSDVTSPSNHPGAGPLGEVPGRGDPAAMQSHPANADALAGDGPGAAVESADSPGTLDPAPVVIQIRPYWAAQPDSASSPAEMERRYRSMKFKVDGVEVAIERKAQGSTPETNVMYQNPGPHWVVNVDYTNHPHLSLAAKDKLLGLTNAVLSSTDGTKIAALQAAAAAPGLLVRSDRNVFPDVFLGAGSPEAIGVALRLAAYFRKEMNVVTENWTKEVTDKETGEKTTTSGSSTTTVGTLAEPIEDWLNKFYGLFIGLYCTGFPGNFSRQGGYLFGPTDAIGSYHKNPRAALSEILANDVLVWKEYGHIAIIDSVVETHLEEGWIEAVVIECCGENDAHGLTNSHYHIGAPKTGNLFLVNAMTPPARALVVNREVYICPLNSV
jgi:phage baseplate assembly protein gpV